MKMDDVTDQILSTARMLCAGLPDQDAFEHARDMNLLDGSGAPTSLGKQLVKALYEQTGTRTAFRPFV